jgi:YggT family protein
MLVSLLYTAVRTLVIIALIYASLVALTHWAIRTRRINPFGMWPRLVRRVSDPVLLRLERRIIGSGGSPQTAPLWLLGIVVAGGLVLMSLTGWLIEAAVRISGIARSEPRLWIQSLVSFAFTVVMAAILIRVIASWFGIGGYRKWMRPIYALTSWIIEPIRRILPPFGMFDFSPMVAWLVLYVLRGFVLGLI